MTRLIHMRDTTRSYVTIYDSFTCVTWINHMMTRDILICVTWLVHSWQVMTHSYMWHVHTCDKNHESWHVCSCDMTRSFVTNHSYVRHVYMYDMNQSYVTTHASFIRVTRIIRVTWLVYTSRLMTHSYVWHVIHISRLKTHLYMRHVSFV